MQHAAMDLRAQHGGLLRVGLTQPTGDSAVVRVLVDEGKDDGLAATSISPKLAPLVAFLRDDKNLTKQLGPEDTTAEMVKKRVKVVRYSDFGKAVDSASRLIAKNYQVSVGPSDYRRGTGPVFGRHHAGLQPALVALGRSTH